MLTHDHGGLRRLLDRFTAWEHRLALHFNRPNSRRLWSALFGGVSRLGDGLFWYLLMAGLLLFDGTAALKPVVVMVLTGMACTLTYRWIKQTTTR